MDATCSRLCVLFTVMLTALVYGCASESDGDLYGECDGAAVGARVIVDGAVVGTLEAAGTAKNNMPLLFGEREGDSTQVLEWLYMKGEPSGKLSTIGVKRGAHRVQVALAKGDTLTTMATFREYNTISVSARRHKLVFEARERG
jgi:hypothetical protein